MPIDGTYGRLSAHNQRFKELRRKKIERRENKIWRNSLSSTQRGESGIENNFETIDPKKLEAIKIEIRKKAKAQLRHELYLYLLSIIVTCGLIYFLFFY
ncbi:hypothetical protein [Winogradskyella aquimaris]|uniref:Uncharacterized protein n=1 Tax=Winogradskyella aquimaris TaxID=864074 RepID=A0ABU5ET32_9FLAO|nr:hypothetical protein [Winogradskyella aquimaris]MDY2588061.1 hypothetical protein [Winogradskyella aquimaris]